MVADIFDYFSAEFRNDPYAVYRRVRATNPVHHGLPFDEGGAPAWHVLRHADILQALKDHRLTHHASEPEGDAALSLADPIALFGALARQSLLFNDPPSHTRLRGLVSAVFTPRMIDGLRPRIGAIADALLAEAATRGELDIVSDYALPLTLTLIAEMLGVPAEAKPRLSQWARVLVRAVDCKRAEEIGPAYERAAATCLDIFGYFSELLAEKRAHPGADLLSKLLVAHQQEDRLSEQELIVTATTLLMAGHETTVNLIGNGMLLLLQHPDQMRLLTENPALITPAIEEFLRFHSPSQMASRYVTTEIKLGGTVIPSGQVVNLVLGAGNHDPDVFADPERCDITRTGPRHLAFGMGIHYCLGAPLARLESAIAIPRLLARFPGLRLSQTAPVWRETISFRGLEGLSVVW
ncbi:MAG TPA: cytochrome P450 [Ktedonobacterales bacterium]